MFSSYEQLLMASKENKHGKTVAIVQTNMKYSTCKSSKHKNAVKYFFQIFVVSEPSIKLKTHHQLFLTRNKR